MVTTTLNKFMTSIFGSRNERLIKAYRKRVAAINAFEAEIREKSDAELRARAGELAKKLENKKVTDADVLPEAFAIIS